MWQDLRDLTGLCSGAVNDGISSYMDRVFWRFETEEQFRESMSPIYRGLEDIGEYLQNERWREPTGSESAAEEDDPEAEAELEPQPE